MKSKRTKKRQSDIAGEFRLPANVMHEEAWEDDGPNMKLARAFVVVLVLHIIAVAGLAAFNFFDDSKSKIGSDATLPAKPLTPAVKENGTATKMPPATDDRPFKLEGMRAVTVEKPMSTALFALQYGLTEEELLMANRHTPLVSGPLLKDEKIYIPDSASLQSDPIEKLPVAPVVDPPAVAGSPSSSTPASREIVQPRPPKPETVAQNTTVKNTPPPTPPKAKPRVTPKPPQSKPSKPATQSSSGKFLSHKVRSGENLYRISRKYGVSQAAIQRANGITNPAMIRANQVLKIPK